MKKIFVFLTSTLIFNCFGQIISTVAGNGTLGYSGDGGQATSAEFDPWGITFDSQGNLFLADANYNVIRKINTLGVIATVAGNGMYPNGIGGYGGDGGQATDAELGIPHDVVFDINGNMFISDFINQRIRMVNTFGIISTIAGNGTAGYSGDGGQATDAQLWDPANLRFDANGNLYVSDLLNHRIRRISTSGIISTIAGNGIAGYNGDGGQATLAELNQPVGLAFDALGNIYVGDQISHNIRKINTSGIITTIAGTSGIGGFSGDGGQAIGAALGSPGGLFVDVNGNLFIADSHNHRIRVINTVGVINTFAGNGTAGYSGDGGQCTAAELYTPSSLVFDGLGNLYFSDNGNYRLRKINNTSAVGIIQFMISNETKIYPNPNKGFFIVETNTTTKQTLQVFDVNSKLVLTQIIQPTPNTSKEGNSTTIDACNLVEGVYNLSIISNEGVVNKRLVIVR